MKENTKGTIFMLVYIFLFLMLVNLSSAYMIGDNQLKFTCTLNNAIPSPSTVYNISIDYSNGTTLLPITSATSMGSGLFYYNINFAQKGTYTIHSFCYDGNYSYSNSENIVITQSGEELSSGSSTLYAILILLSFSLLIFFIYAGVSIEGKNYKDDEGIVNVNNKKYLKMGCYAMAYVLLIWFVFNLYTISNNYLQLPFMSNFFWTLWTILGWSLIPLIPAYIIFNIWWMFVDAKFKKMFEQGIPCLNE